MSSFLLQRVGAFSIFLVQTRDADPQRPFSPQREGNRKPLRPPKTSPPPFGLLPRGLTGPKARRPRHRAASRTRTTPTLARPQNGGSRDRKWALRGPGKRPRTTLPSVPREALLAAIGAAARGLQFPAFRAQRCQGRGQAAADYTSLRVARGAARGQRRAGRRGSSGREA